MTLDLELARERLRSARLCLLLTRRLCRLDPMVVLDEALTAGVDLVQVREPELADRRLLAWVHDVRERTARHRVPLIVNDRPDVALLAGAEGVHVGQDDLPPRAVRELIGQQRILGFSTHDHYQVTEADHEPVDYIGIGPVFDTDTKALEGQGPELLRETLPVATHPAFAIGGIDAGTAATAVEAGAKRLAVSSAICAAEEPRRAVEALLSVLSG